MNQLSVIYFSAASSFIQALSSSSYSIIFENSENIFNSTDESIPEIGDVNQDTYSSFVPTIILCISTYSSLVIAGARHLKIEEKENNVSNLRNRFTELVSRIKHNLFNMVLENKMEYYGMRNSPYGLVNTVVEKDQIITTWEPPKTKKSNKGIIKLSQKDKLIHGLISYDNKGEILAKQFFEDYLNIGGLMIPQKVTQIGYFESPTVYKITTYRNFKLNNFEDEKNYSYNFSTIKP